MIRCKKKESSQELNCHISHFFCALGLLLHHHTYHLESLETGSPQLTNSHIATVWSYDPPGKRELQPGSNGHTPQQSHGHTYNGFAITSGFGQNCTIANNGFA